jgi:hypothetical protein
VHGLQPGTARRFLAAGCLTAPAPPRQTGRLRQARELGARQASFELRDAVGEENEKRRKRHNDAKYDPGQHDRRQRAVAFVDDVSQPVEVLVQHICTFVHTELRRFAGTPQPL